MASRVWILLIGILMIVTKNCYGFTERSNVSNSDPAITTEPRLILGIDERTSIEPLVNDSIAISSVELSSQVSEGNRSLNVSDEKCCSSTEDTDREKKSEDIDGGTNRLTNLENNTSTSKDLEDESSSSPELEITSETNSDTKTPRNVILLLVNDTGLNGEMIWKEFEPAIHFPDRGYLSNCRIVEIPSESTNFWLDDSLVFVRNEDCDCDEIMQSKVQSLITSAEKELEMLTSIIFPTKFLNPSVLINERSTTKEAEEFIGYRKNLQSQDFPPFRFNRDRAYLSTLEKQSPFSPSVGRALLEAEQNVIYGNDKTWDVFDVFSRIRIAFFRILLESLGGGVAKPENEIERKSFPSHSGFADFFTDEIDRLKSASNGKRFALVAYVSGNELSTAVKIIQRHISTGDTLLVLIGNCSTNNGLIPFFADGPGKKTIHEARQIIDIPDLIVKSLECRNNVCSNEFSKGIGQSSSSLIMLRLFDDVPKKRVARSIDKSDSNNESMIIVEETTKQSSIDKKKEETIGTAIPERETTVAPTRETTAVPERETTRTAASERRNGSIKMTIDNLTTIMGIVISVITMFALSF